MLADAVSVLELGRASIQRSKALLRSSRALCSRIEAAHLASSAAPADLPAPLAATAPAAQKAPRCTFPRCSRPSPFRACFFVRAGQRTLFLHDLSLRVCAEHRAELDALFRRASVLESLRRKLLARGRGAPEAVRVLFEAVA